MSQTPILRLSASHCVVPVEYLSHLMALAAQGARGQEAPGGVQEADPDEDLPPEEETETDSSEEPRGDGFIQFGFGDTLQPVTAETLAELEASIAPDDDDEPEEPEQ